MNGEDVTANLGDGSSLLRNCDTAKEARLTSEEPGGSEKTSRS